MAVVADLELEQKESGDLILWILVFSELAAFGILLGGFLVGTRKGNQMARPALHPVDL